jgi:prepilin-type N-terminal cleavage/methylation domain-containing protein
MQRTGPHRRCGYTLVELVIVLAVLAGVCAIGIRAIGHQLDRVAVVNAIGEAAEAMARARDEALARHAMVSVHIDTAGRLLTLHTHGARLPRHALGHAHGVSLATTRDSVVFDARGLGYGAANLTLVARRGSAAETLVVSRLGRLRH